MKYHLTKISCLLATFSSLSFAINAQTVKLTSNGKEVKTLNCDMTDVKLTVNFSESAKKYDVVDVVIKRFSDKEAKKTPLDYYLKYHKAYEYRLPIGSIDNLKHTFHLVNNDKSDLWVGYYNYYQLTEACDYSLRDFETLYNVVYVVGGTHSGYRWEDNKQVKTYDWSTINTMTFEQELGPVSPVVHSEKKNFSVSRELTQAYDLDDKGDGESIELKSKEAATGGGTFDMGTGQKTGRPATVYAKLMAFNNQSKATVKQNIEQQLISRANYYFSNSIEPIFKSDEIKDMVTPDLVVNSKNATKGEENSGGSGVGSKLKAFKNKMASAAGGSGGVDKNKETLKGMIENSGVHFNWESENINGIDFEMVSFKYAEKQHFQLDAGKRSVLKSGKEEFIKEYKFYITEKNGVVLVLFAKQEGDEALTGKMLQNYDTVFDTVNM